MAGDRCRKRKAGAGSPGGEPPEPPRDGPRKTRDGVPLDVRLGDGPPRPSARPEPHEVPDAAALAKLARPGIIVDDHPRDALGRIELEGDRERIRFGAGALEDVLPEVGTAVRVVSVGVGYRGVPKAARVVRAAYTEPPPLQPPEHLTRGAGPGRSRRRILGFTEPFGESARWPLPAPETARGNRLNPLNTLWNLRREKS